MSEQKINVKNTYVATVKNDVVEKALSFYAKGKEDFFVESSVFPSVSNTRVDNDQLNIPVENNETPNNGPIVEIPRELNLDNTITIPIVEETKTAEPVVSDSAVNISNSELVDNSIKEDSTQSVSSASLQGIPNLSVLEPIPNVPATPVQPQPIPNPEPTPVSASPINDTFTNIDNMINVASSQPVRFDASHETNLLNTLGDSDGQSKIGNINVTPENLNSVREFGVDQPAINNVPVQNGSGGFVNNKIVLVIVILLFLASCVFLGYEIYNYFVLSK